MLALDPNQLPKDVDLLHKIVVELCERLKHETSEKDKYHSLLQRLNSEVEAYLAGDQIAHRITEAGVSAPSVVYKVEPNYSKKARKAKLQGTVTLFVVVDEQGIGQNIKIARSLRPAK